MAGKKRLPGFDGIDEFWSRVDQSTGREGCWIWLGASAGSTGYGQVTLFGQHWMTHRLAAYLSGLPVQDHLVCHTCDNPFCCNPRHLFIGSYQDNMDDRMLKGRTACGELQGKAVLTEAIVRKIRQSSESYAALGKKYGVSKSNIYAVVKRITWKHVI